MSFAGERVTLRCPACRATSFLLTETMEELVHYEIVDGVMPDAATDHEVGGAIRLDAVCRKCGHAWAPRAKLLGQVIA